ncbi:MAG: hypothetical protein CI948_2784, partial [Halanaerobium sp.]
MDNDIIENLLDVGFYKENNKLFKKINKENKDLIDKLDIKSG